MGATYVKIPQCVRDDGAKQNMFHGGCAANLVTMFDKQLDQRDLLRFCQGSRLTQLTSNPQNWC